MGDNGHFTKYSPGSGFTAMIFKGGKGDSTEGDGIDNLRPETQAAVKAFLAKNKVLLEAAAAAKQK